MAKKQELKIDRDFKPSSFIEIMFDTNNDNISRHNYVSQCKIGEMTLETIVFGGVDFQIDELKNTVEFKIENKIFPAIKQESDRMFWKTVRSTPETAIDLINHLQVSKNWHVTLAPTLQFDKFKDGEPFTEQDLKCCL